MGYKEDNEREMGEMTLERLRMRQMVDAEYRKTVEQQAETKRRVAELKAQEDQFKSQLGMAPPPAQPAGRRKVRPGYTLTDQGKQRPMILRAVFQSAFIGLIPAIPLGGVTYYTMNIKHDPAASGYPSNYPLLLFLGIWVLMFVGGLISYPFGGFDIDTD